MLLSEYYFYYVKFNIKQISNFISQPDLTPKLHIYISNRSPRISHRHSKPRKTRLMILPTKPVLLQCSKVLSPSRSPQLLKPEACVVPSSTLSPPLTGNGLLHPGDALCPQHPLCSASLPRLLTRRWATLTGLYPQLLCSLLLSSHHPAPLLQSFTAASGK